MNVGPITIPLRASGALGEVASRLKGCVKEASSIYSRLPISDLDKYRHAVLLAKYAPWVLRALYGEYRLPRPQVAFVEQFDIDRLLEGRLKICSSDAPEVSVIIPAFCNCEYTLRCLASIALNPPAVPFEVIVVDDSSPDGSAARLSSIPGIRLLVNPENQGFIRSCNAGAAAAAGRFFCFLNNDTEVAPGWLDELYGTFREFPGTGLCGSKLVYPDGTLQEAGGIIWRDCSAWNFGRNKDQLDPLYNYAREVDYCSGASIMVPRELFQSFGGFDERYLPAYCEDSDLALKLRHAGYGVIYQPLSVVIHHEGVSCGTDTARGVKAYQVENSRKLSERWRDKIGHHQDPGVDVDAAKDRTARRRVLVLEHCTPTPDQDAGSVTVYNLLLLLREMGFQVTFIPENNFSYLPDYTPALQRAGIEVIYGPHCTYLEKHLKKAGKRYDLVFMFRPVVVERHIELVRRYCGSARVLFHTVDLHFLRMSREAELLGDPEKKKAADEMKERELAAIRAVDASIVHSTAELEMLRPELPHERIHVFPLILDIRGTDRRYEERKDLVFVGGYQHLPNVDAVKFFVTEVMPHLRKRLPGVRFHVVGSNPPPEITALESSDVVIAGFVEDLDPLLAAMRVSVAPLRFGAGIKGKIGTAMALGLPTVTTSLGAEGMSLSDGENILVADDAEPFAAAIARLYGDPVLWDKLSRNGISFAERAWGGEAAWGILAGILEELGMPVTRGSKPLLLYSRQQGGAGSLSKVNQQGKQMAVPELHPVGSCSTAAEFRELLAGEGVAKTAEFEERLLSRAKAGKPFTVRGWCAPCGKDADFQVDMTCGGRREGDSWIPNWRERLVCPHCGMNNRQRLVATLVGQHLEGAGAGTRVYLMEQVTPIYQWAKSSFASCRITGSEYLGPGYQSGSVVKGIRHEDVMALSFADATFDLIVSNDVFEHVPDPARSFSECARVLRPGGVMLATIPFHSGSEASVTRARLDQGKLTHLLPPMYHGNPVSRDGSLVFTDFGWDLVESIRTSGFEEISCEIFASRENGHLGGGQIVFRGVKGSAGEGGTSPDAEGGKPGDSALVAIMGEVLWHSLTIDPTIEEISKRHFGSVESVLEKYYRQPKSRRPLRILEIAAYAHTTGYMLARKFGAEVVLADISVDTLALGARSAEASGYDSALARRVAADFHDLPFSDGEFDLVYISSALHHTVDWELALHEMTRVLAPGGLLYLENEPCLREFCFYKFGTNRVDAFRPVEKCLDENGLILTVAQPYLGTRPETLFGMVENQSIPLGEMLELLRAVGKTEMLKLTPELCMRRFESQLVRKRKSGPQALQKMIYAALKSGIAEAEAVLGPHDVALGYTLPTDRESLEMASRIAHRLAALKGWPWSESYRTGLARIFGAGVTVLLRKDGPLPEKLPDLKMRHAWGERKGVTIGYPEKIERILHGMQDILPDVQTATEAGIRDAFPVADWALERLENGLRQLSSKGNGSRIFCRSVALSGRLRILMRLYALFDHAPYRIHLKLNGVNLCHFDVYQTESFLFNSEAAIPGSEFLLTVTSSWLDTPGKIEQPPPICISAVRLCATSS